MDGIETRKYWVDILIKLVEPVLNNASEGRLRERLPYEKRSLSDTTKELNKAIGGFKPGEKGWMEAVSRSLCGIAPWLELGESHDEEGHLRKKYAELSRKTIDNITDLKSPDYCNFAEGDGTFPQELVESAFLSLAILRAPNELWHKLDERVKRNVMNAIQSTRKIRPPRSNWLCFSGINEAALHIMGVEADMMRVDYTIGQFQQWYKGSGFYGDGPDLAMDYYNSFVIQPMLVEIISTFKDSYSELSNIIFKHVYFITQGSPEITVGEKMYQMIMENAKKYAGVLETLIAPDGTFPPLGRSITYRCAAFQGLAQAVQKGFLPERIKPGQARSALTAVISRCFEHHESFDEQGWLNIGLYGRQLGLAEDYISRGSVYLCSTVFLPLGLSAEDSFWSDPPEKWTSQKIWSGEDVKK